METIKKIFIEYVKKKWREDHNVTLQKDQLNIEDNSNGSNEGQKCWKTCENWITAKW